MSRELHASRDVKTSNILLTRGGAAKVADVGLATMTDCFSSASNAHGTFLYAAPEVLMGKPSTAKVTDAMSCDIPGRIVLSTRVYVQ